MALSVPARTALRTTTRVSMLVIAAGGLVPLGALIYSTLTSGWRAGPDTPAYVGLALIAPLLATVGFWATGSDRHQAVALAATVALFVDYVALSGYTMWLNHSHSPNALPGLSAWSEIIDTIYPLTILVYLCLSYRGPALGMTEHNGRWLRLVGLPQVLVAVCGVAASIFMVTSQPVGMIVLICAAALYAWLRHRHPRPGATSWATVTLLLVVPALPTYALSLIGYGLRNLVRPHWAQPAAVILECLVLGVLVGAATRALRSRRQSSTVGGDSTDGPAGELPAGRGVSGEVTENA